VSFAAINLCVASQRVFIVVSVYFVIDSVRKLLDTPSYVMSYSAKWGGGQIYLYFYFYMLEDRGSIRGKGREGIYLFATASRPDLGPTQPSMQWVSEAPSPVVQRPGSEADRPLTSI
jgi:hypothetical protein